MTETYSGTIRAVTSNFQVHTMHRPPISSWLGFLSEHSMSKLMILAVTAWCLSIMFHNL